MNIVNGYVCRNCTDVELAKKGVDPAHPHDGPNGVEPRTPDAGKADGSAAGAQASRGPAVTYAGALQGADSTQGSADAQPSGSAWASLQLGQRLSLEA